ncbi:MAG: GDP-mannose 4,6-dehydratase [Planctomycetes bacterium]|nr:GDP-mannose 4,6-dehydratase [Planctomycetota bacterium]
MSILVTGGAGFIGSHLLDRLAEQKRAVICLDNFNDYYSARLKRRNIDAAMSSGQVELVEGDIRDKNTCRRIFKDYEVDRVVHLAARAGVRPSIEKPVLYEQVNCQGTIHLLESAREADVDMFVFGSSSSVYGVSERIPFQEDDPVDLPISPYAASKRSGELYCRAWHHLYGLPIVALRFFTVYGPRQRPDLAISKFTRLIEAGEPIPMFGDGSSRRDYTYVSDIIDGVVAALDSNLKFEIINLGNSDPVELQHLIHLIEKALGEEAKIKQLPDQPGDVPITYADVSRAQELLNYHPQVPIEEGIEAFVRWFRQNGTARSQGNQSP